MTRQKKSDLQKRLDRRNASFERATDAIFESISGVIAGIEAFARSEDVLTEDNVLEMITISIDEEAQIVYMAGAFKPTIGTTVMLTTGEQFPVETEQDRSDYAKILRLSLPTEIVEKNDPDETLQYIHESNERLKQIMEEMEAAFDEGDGEEAEALPSTLTDEDRKNEERLTKILEGATNPSGLFN